MKALFVFFFAAVFAAAACNDNAKSRNTEDTTRNVSPTDTSTMRTDTTHTDTTMHR